MAEIITPILLGNRIQHDAVRCLRLLQQGRFQLYCFTSPCQLLEHIDKVITAILGRATADRVMLQL